jgi:hypothetical protein
MGYFYSYLLCYQHIFCQWLLSSPYTHSSCQAAMHSGHSSCCGSGKPSPPLVPLAWGAVMVSYCEYFLGASSSLISFP